MSGATDPECAARLQRPADRLEGRRHRLRPAHRPRPEADRVPGDPEVSPAAAPPSPRAGALRRLAGAWVPRVAAIIGVGVIAYALVHSEAGDPARRGEGRAPATAAWSWKLPAGFPTPKVPASNPMSAKKVDLGRFLFYDTRLSGNGTQSCGSCHHQDKAFTDGRAQSIGSTGETHPRSALSLANVVYNADPDLGEPVARHARAADGGAPVRRRGPSRWGSPIATRPQVLRSPARDRRYRAKFAAAFPGQRAPITLGNVVKAIASFQRTLISVRQPLRPLPARHRAHDRRRRRAARTCSSASAPSAATATPASTSTTRWSTPASGWCRRPFHNTGLYNLGGTGAFPEPNRGVFELTGRAARHGPVPRAHPAQRGGHRAVHARRLDRRRSSRSWPSTPPADATSRSGPRAGDGRLNPFKSPLIDNIDLDRPGAGRPRGIPAHPHRQEVPDRAETLESVRSAPIGKGPTRTRGSPGEPGTPLRVGSPRRRDRGLPAGSAPDWCSFTRRIRNVYALAISRARASRKKRI